jgi:hypothetical protein
MAFALAFCRFRRRACAALTFIPSLPQAGAALSANKRQQTNKPKTQYEQRH